MFVKNGVGIRELILAILLASLANTLTKGALVFFLGAKSMRLTILPAVVLIATTTGALICFYI